MNSNPHITPALVFDFGGVLIDWDPRYLYQKHFPGDPEGMERFLAEVDFTAWNLRQDAGRPFAEAVAEHSARFPEYARLIRAYDEEYLDSLGEPIWPVVEIVAELKQRGYPLYALSNWSGEKFALVRPMYDFFSWFEAILISGEVKMAKPDPGIFHLLAETIGRPPQECLFIDDSAANISTASRLGFQTIRYHSPEQLREALDRAGIVLARNGHTRNEAI